MKHFDIDGIAETVQLGKRGPHIAADKDAISVTKLDGSPAVLRAAPGSEQDDVVTISQLGAVTNQLTSLTASLTTQVSSSDAAMSALSQEIAQLHAMVTKLMPVAPDSYDVGPTLANGTLLGTLKDGVRVASVSIEVKEAFDGDVSLLVGDGAKPDFYMDADHSDLAYPGTYTMTPPDSNPDTMVTASLTGSATKGSAVIRISYS